MNEFVLSGTAMGTPELKTTEGGLKVAELVLNVKRSFKNKDGSQEEDLIKINLFKKLAEESEDIVDGSLLLVKGHIYSNNTNKDGKLYSFPNIVADRIENLR